VSVGTPSSTTVTVAVAEQEAPWESVAVTATLVVPSGYGPAGDCVRVIVSPLSESKEPLSIEAFAMQLAPAETVTFLLMTTGGAFSLTLWAEVAQSLASLTTTW
jgi:hypothetical protein